MAGGVGEDAAVERPALEVLAGLGWKIVSGFDEVLGVAGTLGRDRDSQAVLVHRLRDRLEELNPDVPGAGLDRAVEELTVTRSAMDPVRANREVWDLLRDGFPVEVDVEGGGRETKRVRFVDWNDPSRNEFLAVSQLWLRGPLYRRRPDVVLFVNGVPLVLMEFKAPHVNVRAAYLHLMADAAVSAGVVVAGLVMLATDWRWVDPVASLLVSVVILRTGWLLLREAFDLSTDAVPRGIDLGEVQAFLEARPFVCDVHDVHVWAMSSTENAMTAHVVLEEAADQAAWLADVHAAMRDRFGICHCTVQTEHPQGGACLTEHPGDARGPSP